MRGREALFFQGLARYQQGDFASAIRSWRTLASHVPMAEVFNNLGAAELRAGEASALHSLEKAVETDPSDPDFHFNLGYAYWRAGLFEKAAMSLRKSLERRPEDELATLLLGRCLQRVGPRPGDLRTEAVERLKTEYNDAAFLALKAILKAEP
jgi:Tfp pilus assembly protein PilF